MLTVSAPKFVPIACVAAFEGVHDRAGQLRAGKGKYGMLHHPEGRKYPRLVSVEAYEHLFGEGLGEFAIRWFQDPKSFGSLAYWDPRLAYHLLRSLSPADDADTDYPPSDCEPSATAGTGELHQSELPPNVRRSATTR